MARPALRAPPGRRRALANAPYDRTRPRGICFTSRYTISQDILFTRSFVRWRHPTKFRICLLRGNDKATAAVFDTLKLESEQWFDSQPSTAKGRTRYRKHISLRRI